MAVHRISLNDCLAPTSPPEKLLTLGVVEDTAFVYISAVTGTDSAETQTPIAEIAVSLGSLREALQLLSADRDRESLRPQVSEHGDREAGLSGNRLVIARA